MVSDEIETADLLNSYFASEFTQEESGDLAIAESIYHGGEESLYRRSRPEWQKERSS